MKPIRLNQAILHSAAISLTVLFFLSGCARDRNYTRLGQTRYQGLYGQEPYQGQVIQSDPAKFGATGGMGTGTSNQSDPWRKRAEEEKKATDYEKQNEQEARDYASDKNIENRMETSDEKKDAIKSRIDSVYREARKQGSNISFIALPNEIEDQINLTKICADYDPDGDDTDDDGISDECEKGKISKSEGRLTLERNPNLFPVTAFLVKKQDWDPSSKKQSLLGGFWEKVKNEWNNSANSSDLIRVITKIFKDKGTKESLTLLREWFESSTEKLKSGKNYELVNTLISDRRNNPEQLPGIEFPATTKRDEIFFYVSQFYYFPGQGGDKIALAKMSSDLNKPTSLVSSDSDVVMALYAGEKAVLSTSPLMPGGTQALERNRIEREKGGKCGVPMTLVVAMQPKSDAYSKMIWHNIFVLTKAHDSELGKDFSVWNFLDRSKVSPKQIEGSNCPKNVEIFPLTPDPSPGESISWPVSAKTNPPVETKVEDEPSPAQNPQVVPMVQFLVPFGSGKFQLSQETKNVLDDVVEEILNPYSKLIRRVDIYGFANKKSGDIDQKNADMAKKRADSVKVFLQDKVNLDYFAFSQYPDTVTDPRNQQICPLDDDINCAAVISINLSGSSEELSEAQKVIQAKYGILQANLFKAPKSSSTNQQTRGTGNTSEQKPVQKQTTRRFYAGFSISST